MNDGINRIAVEQVGDQRCITDITLNEGVPAGIGQFFEVLCVARIGQHIQIDDLNFWFCFEDMVNEIRADEPCSACDQYIFHFAFLSQFVMVFRIRSFLLTTELLNGKQLCL